MTKSIDLKKVAGEVLDGWRDAKFKRSLMEHDMHYHDGHYRGGKCIFREQLDREDHTIDDLSSAEQKEGAIYSGRRYEGAKLEASFNEAFGLGQKQGTRTQMFEPDEKGENEFKVWCSAETPNSQFPGEKLRSFFKGEGYELRSARAKVVSGKGGRDKDKKVLTFVLYKPENMKFAEENENDVGRTVTYSGSGNLNERTKNRVMKKYGIKSEGGKFVKRTADDTKSDRIKRYLGIVGDIDGQSNREDVESGVWEKRRLDMLKRAKETRDGESE